MSLVVIYFCVGFVPPKENFALNISFIKKFPALSMLFLHKFVIFLSYNVGKNDQLVVECFE